MISHHHKCVFVHVPKTAGQSVERVFLELLGLTWETRAPLLLRHNSNPELGPPRLAHLRASEYTQCRYMTEEQFDSYFCFSFVRNPWDRVVSMYKYLGSPTRYDFHTFVSKILRKHVWKNKYWFVRPQADYLFSDSGERLVDFVGRFESLQADFDEICMRIGLPPIELPHTNKSKSSGRDSGAKAIGLAAARDVLNFARLNWRREPISRHSRYQDYYNSETREIVEELYRRDIDAFDYSFEGAAPADESTAIAASRHRAV